MFQSLYFMFFLVVLVFALGDITGAATKGKLSGMMVTMLIFLVCFLAGVFPKDIIDQAGLTQIGNLAIGMVLFNMGTTINYKQLIREWKTVALAALCMLASCVMMLCVIPIVGKDAVLVGMPVINGAAMVTKLMTDAATERGLATAAALCAVIYSVQKFVGAPIASAMGVKYAKKLVAQFRADPEAARAAWAAKQNNIEAATGKKPFYERHASFFTANTNIAIAALGGFIGRWLGSITPINYAIWALVLGCFSGIGGFIPPKPLQRSSSYGFMMIAVFGSIIPALGKVSLSDLGTMAFQTIVLFAAAVLGIFLLSYVLPAWKLVGDKDLAMGVGVEQFLGFPNNVVIAREVAQAVGETEEEKAYIEDTISVPYVVGGITVVTILSVTMAGIVINML
jgi:hypothetical protein